METNHNRFDIDIDDMELEDDTIESQKHQSKFSAEHFVNMHRPANDELKEDRSKSNVRLLEPDNSSKLTTAIPRVWESLTNTLQSNGYLNRSNKYQKVRMNDQDDVDEYENDDEENLMHSANYGDIHNSHNVRVNDRDNGLEDEVKE